MEDNTDVSVFESKAIAMTNVIANIEKKKKEIAKVEEDMRAKLFEAMDKYDIKSFEHNGVKVTYVEATTRTSIDTARLKREEPAIAIQYSKTSPVKACIKITVK